AISMDAGTATPTVIMSRNLGTTYNPAMSPDGSLVTAAGGQPVMSMPSLTDVDGFPTTGGAAAVSGDNAWMATGDTNLQVTAKAAAAPLNTYPIRPQALAFAPDNSRLYVLVSPGYGDVSLETIVAPTLTRPTLTLAKSRRTSTAGLPVTLT